MKNSTIVRQVVNRLNEIAFNAGEDHHTFGDIYESLLYGLQSAGNYGEFYIPRTVTENHDGNRQSQARRKGA